MFAYADHVGRSNGTEPAASLAVLRSGQPSIVIGGSEERPGLAMNSFMLQPGKDQIVTEQLVKVLRAPST